MTCIIGLEHNDGVYMIGDSSAIQSYETRQSLVEKVFFAVGDRFLIGWSGSFRMGQILQWHLQVREQYDTEVDLQYLVKAFVESVRTLFKEHGYLSTTDEGRDIGGQFLLGYNGRLYHVYPDFQINRFSDGFGAIGSGEEYALGAMKALVTYGPDPAGRLHRAIAVAAHYTGTVKAPFYVKQLLPIE